MAKTDADKIKWLLGELPELQREGVLGGDEAERLRAWYEPGAEAAASPLRRYFLLALAVIGLLLLSGGVILIFSDAWDLLPRSAHLAAAFAPLSAALCCGVYTIVRGKDARWREASSLFTATGFAVLLAIVSRVCNLGGSFAEYMEYVLLCSIPLVYIFDGQALAAACCLGLFALLGGGVSLSARLLCLGGLLPFVALRSFDFRGRGNSAWMRWFSLAPAAFLAVVSERDFMTNLVMVSFALLLAGLAAWDAEGRRANPWLAAGWLLAAALATAGGAASSFWSGLASDAQPAAGLLQNGGTWLPLLIVCATLACLRRTGFSLLLLIFPLLTAAGRLSLLPAAFLYRCAALCAFVMGSLLLAGGFRRHSLVLINAGAVQIILLFFIKFVTADLDMLALGLLFIVTGAVFIAANLYLSRRFKAEEADGTAHDDR